MISNLLLKVLDRMHDWKTSGMVAGAAGGVVGERTVRNWLSNRRTPDPELLERVRRESLKLLLKDLEGKGWDPAERGTFAAELDAFYRYPTRRLLDTTACMRAMCANPAGRWPSTIPPVEDMVRWLDLAGCGELASNLSKWRGGRPLTLARSQDLWNACFAFIPEATRPSAPVPMLYAATVFTEMFVRGSLADRDLTFFCLDPAYYRSWWEIQRQTLQSGRRLSHVDTESWMPGLV